MEEVFIYFRVVWELGGHGGKRARALRQIPCSDFLLCYIVAVSFWITYIIL